MVRMMYFEVHGMEADCWWLLLANYVLQGLQAWGWQVCCWALID